MVPYSCIIILQHPSLPSYFKSIFRSSWVCVYPSCVLCLLGQDLVQGETRAGVLTLSSSSSFFSSILSIGFTLTEALSRDQHEFGNSGMKLFFQSALVFSFGFLDFGLFLWFFSLIIQFIVMLYSFLDFRVTFFSLNVGSRADL